MSTPTMQMHLRDILFHTKADFIAGNAVTWIGPPGGGKSFTIRQLCEWMMKTYAGMRIGLSTTFMATQSPIGLGGLPWKGMLEYAGKQYTITDPAIPQWYLAVDLATGELAPADTFDKVLLVMEEWGQGDAETKRAGAELFYTGSCNRFSLPKGSFRLALSNNDVRDGITKEFDFIIGRRSEYHVRGDVKVFIEDYADKPQLDNGRTWLMMGETKAWAMKNPDKLFEAKPKEQGPWCNPRTLTMADRYSQVLAEMNGGKLPLEDHGYTVGLAGKIGTPAAMSLIGEFRFRLELPSYEDVVKDPMNTEVPAKIDQTMTMVYALAGQAQAEDLPQLLQYVNRIKQKDMHISFVSSLLRRDYKSIIEQPAMQAWISANAQLVSIVAGLAQNH